MTTKSPKQLEREIAATLVDAFSVNHGNYRVMIAPDPQRGGYSAAVSSVGTPNLGAARGARRLIMEATGGTPRAALTALVRALRGDWKLRSLAAEIAEVGRERFKHLKRP